MRIRPNEQHKKIKSYNKIKSRNKIIITKLQFKHNNKPREK